MLYCIILHFFGKGTPASLSIHKRDADCAICNLGCLPTYFGVCQTMRRPYRYMWDRFPTPPPPPPRVRLGLSASYDLTHSAQYDMAAYDQMDCDAFSCQYSWSLPPAALCTHLLLLMPWPSLCLPGFALTFPIPRYSRLRHATGQLLRLATTHHRCHSFVQMGVGLSTWPCFMQWGPGSVARRPDVVPKSIAMALVRPAFVD